MRVLVVGANGFIGSAVVARLAGDGHAVIAVVRRAAAAARLDRLVETRVLDVARARPQDWAAPLAGVDAVVNCAGVLQDSFRDRTAVHAAGAAALFAACEQAGVRRLVQVSATGVDHDAGTAFMRSKLKGDQDLMTRDLDWVLLRPSVVVGSAAYGGSALVRALAALPVLPLAADTGPLQVVQLDDVVTTVSLMVRPEAPSRCVLELVGPRPLSFREVVAAYRRWLGYSPARVLILPRLVSRLMFMAGDGLGWLGWRPPMRSTARREIARGSVGDPAAWQAATGIVPQDLDAALAARPASVQERWFARLYFLKPLVLIVLAAFFVATGLISLGPGWEAGRWLMLKAGASSSVASNVVMAGAAVDIVIGLAIAIRPTVRWALIAALTLAVAYLVAATVLAPALWAEPLGPLTKVFPVMVLILVGLATLDDR